jgi:glycosyltransferase involved in cell wall biosynthesis
MRVAFDGRAFDSPAGGVRRYVSELTQALLAVAPSVDLVAIGGTAIPGGLAHRAASSIVPTNLGWCLAGLPVAARRTPFDVFHAPAYTAPLWGVHPVVLTIHDVSYARRPEWSPHPGGVGATRQWFYRASARTAARIITDSAFSKSEIVEAYGIVPDRIDVVPLGVSRTFRPDEGTPREPMVLHVGDLHPRRNLGLLLDVVIAMRMQNDQLSNLQLVLVGRDLGMMDALRDRAFESGAPDALRHISQPDDGELLQWYRRSAVLAYPSRYEGFGLPVLEAMATGTPVVASRAASIPEVAGDAALLIAPEDRRDWVEALQQVLLNPARAHDLSRRGVRRAAGFTWERTAQLTLAAYDRARQSRSHASPPGASVESGPGEPAGGR